MAHLTSKIRERGEVLGEVGPRPLWFIPPGRSPLPGRVPPRTSAAIPLPVREPPEVKELLHAARRGPSIAGTLIRPLIALRCLDSRLFSHWCRSRHQRACRFVAASVDV